MANFAFRAMQFGKEEPLDPKLAEWKVDIVHNAIGEEERREHIPVRPCTQDEYARFAPPRLDNKNKIESLYGGTGVDPLPSGLLCLDLAKFGKKVEI